MSTVDHLVNEVAKQPEHANTLPTQISSVKYIVNQIAKQPSHNNPLPRQMSTVNHLVNQVTNQLSHTNALPEQVSALLGNDPTIWVFGYGSLMWKTDFPYRRKHVGHIKGFVRRFHQGNETFRGIPGKPGRVANLEADKDGKTWGVAFEIHGQEEVARVLKQLYAREAVAGGYVTMVTTFYPREHPASIAASRSSDSLSSLASEEDDAKLISEDASIVEDTQSVPVLLYTASPDCDLYLGADDVDSMARQIIAAKGTAGTNVEYVTKTADYVRMFIPEDDDVHLFQLDTKIREMVYRAHAQKQEVVMQNHPDNALDHQITEVDFQPNIVKAS